jgi:hypothetical protein
MKNVELRGYVIGKGVVTFPIDKDADYMLVNTPKGEVKIHVDNNGMIVINADGVISITPYATNRIEVTIK